MGDGLLDGGYTPVEDLLKGGGGHGSEDELRELAHVEAARAGLEFVAVVGDAGEIVAALARQPRLLDGYANLPPLRRCIQVAQSVGTELPFVADGDEEVRLDAVDVQRDGAEGLAGVNDECGADLTCALTHADKIDDAAICPVTAWDADNGGAGVDRTEDCIRPASLRIAHDGDDCCVVFSSGFAPGVGDRREGLGEKHDGAARADCHVGGGDGQAIADGGDDGDGVCTGAQDVAGERAKLLGGGKPLCRSERPGHALDVHSVKPRGGDGLHLRRHVGAVEVSDAFRNVEEMCGTDAFHAIHADTGAAGRRHATLKGWAEMPGSHDE